MTLLQELRDQERKYPSLIHAHLCGQSADEIERLLAVVYRLSEDVAFSPMNSSDMDELKARLKYARENLDPPKSE